MLGYRIYIRSDAHEIEIDTRSPKEKNMIPVQQYNLDGELIGEYPSISSAETITRVRHIGEVLNKQRKTAGGYLWKTALD